MPANRTESKKQFNQKFTYCKECAYRWTWATKEYCFKCEAPLVRSTPRVAPHQHKGGQHAGAWEAGPPAAAAPEQLSPQHRAELNLQALAACQYLDDSERQLIQNIRQNIQSKTAVQKLPSSLLQSREAELKKKVEQDTFEARIKHHLKLAGSAV